jgi:hypothetical protein
VGTPGKYGLLGIIGFIGIATIFFIEITPKKDGK